jgi:glycine cleavage system H protein
VTVGVTSYAQQEISDVVFAELPKVGMEVLQGQAVAVVESVKAAFDIYTPVSGKVLGINTALETDPALVNRDPYGTGWFFEMELSKPAEWDDLMSAENYEKMLKQDVK